MIRRSISLVLIFTLIFCQLSFETFAEEINGFKIENSGSFGWTESITIKVTVDDAVRKENPNTIGVGLKKLTKDYRRGSLELSSINGVQPYDNYYTGNTMSENLYNSNEYFDEYGENIYYGYHLPYNGEKMLELTFAADDWVVDYNDYAVYIGFYNIEEIDQATYNAGNQKSNESVSAGELYLRTTEYAVIGTSIQIAPVDIQYKLPSDIEDSEVRIGHDENPYANYLDIWITGRNDYRHNALLSHLAGVEGFKNYEIDHNIYHYNGYDLLEMDEFIESLVTFSYSSQEGYIIGDQEELSPDIVERYGAIAGYRYVGKWQAKEEKEQYYNDDATGQSIKVNYILDKIRYDEIDLIVLPNGLVHKFSFNKYSEFSDSHFMIEERFSNASYEVEHFLMNLNFVPRNNGMTPEEFGEYIKTDDQLSMRLVSNNLTVLNTGVYNTGTKSDSAFNPAFKIQVPDDYAGKLFVTAEVISEDRNPPIGFISSDNPNMVTQNVEGEVLTFNMRTLGAKGGSNNGQIYHPNQKVKFSLKDDAGNTLLKPVFLSVKLIDASPKVIVTKNPGTAQSGSEQAFNIKIVDPDSEEVTIRVTSVFGKIRLANGTFEKTIESMVGVDQEITIGFEAPEIGNFNLNKEMQELSMAALQEGTFNTLLADLEGHYLGQFTEKLKDKYQFNNNIYRSTRDWNNYDEKIEAITAIKAAKDTHDKWSKVNNAYGQFGNAMNVMNAGLGGEQLGKDIYEATNYENKGVFEATADAGIATISILQTGVGLFGTAVSYVPGGKTLSSKTVLWFNLATNVWKGNLKYLSKLEKIDRSEEVQELIPVIIVVTDHTGLSTRFVIMIPVVGMEV